ncbi:Crp/Fnr family transcriptional regulator [Oceanibium sediminis]|uniref:Crp/Fnr family transcriptional regulator n=1 Tax=Oceanibium sediminis TaxID=2026339 RepID=UPI000DD42B66|nr:Crp/Fnr family transcriptional regulator [Oceanibium sediminis]
MALRYNANLQVQYPEDTLLGQVSEQTRNALESCWKERTYSSGQLILDAEAPAGDVLFLLQGAARVANFSAKGREVSFSSIVEGDCFGEFAMLDGAPRSASVLSMDKSRVATVPDAQFRGLLARHPDLSMALMRRLVEKLRDLTRRVSEFTAMRADDRIRLEILRLFRGAEAEDGTALLESPPTQAALAAFVFTNREAVAREIGRMKRKKLIERRGRALYTPSVDMIAEYQEAEAAE